MLHMGVLVFFLFFFSMGSMYIRRALNDSGEEASALSLDITFSSGLSCIACRLC